MTKEEIIATAIREAFKCGKEEGEAYQRMWSNMNENIEKAKKGDPEKPGTESEEVTFQVQSVPGNHIGSEPNDQIAALEKEVNELGRNCEEKDATITELRAELQANKDADTLLCDENRRLLESLTAKDAEIEELTYNRDEWQQRHNDLAVEFASLKKRYDKGI